MNIFETIYDGWNDCSEGALRDRCKGFAWEEIPTTETSDPIKHSRYMFTENGVGVWYCYGADHYWFTDETADEYGVEK